MAKITRKAFTRKKIIIGVAIFAGVTLLAVGVTAIALSNPIFYDNTSSINVEPIDNGGGTFVRNATKLYVTGDESQSISPIYRFEPLSDDRDGRVRYTNGNSEILSLTVEASIEHIERLSFITAKTECKTDEGKQKLLSAIEKGYIIAPESFTSDDTDINVYNIATDTKVSNYFNKDESKSSANRLTFTYDIAFQWGSYFNYKNPCKYYDEDNLDLPIGNANSPIDQTTVYGVISDLQSLLNGVELNLYLTAK